MKACQVTVPDHQLSWLLAIKGKNARLAAKLTGWKIDIKPESGFTTRTLIRRQRPSRNNRN